MIKVGASGFSFPDWGGNSTYERLIISHRIKPPEWH